jgi:hypothetical protein
MLLFVSACSQEVGSKSTSVCGETQATGSKLEAEDPFPGLAPPARGFQVSTAGVMIEPLQQVEYCEIAQLPGTPSDVYTVSSFSVASTTGAHHLIVSAALPDSDSERQLKKVLAEGRQRDICYSALSKYGNDFQPVAGIQFVNRTIKMPKGVARKYHGGQLIVFDFHYWNSDETEAVEARSAVNFEFPDPSECDSIQNIASEFAFYNFLIDVPAHANKPATTTFTGECRFDVDVMLGQLTRHTHEWGDKVRVSYLGGPFDGQEKWTSTDYLHNPDSPETDPPLLMRAGEGLRYSCSYNNTTDRRLRWGVSVDDEMCNLFGTIWAIRPGVDVPRQSCSIVWADEEGLGHAAKEAGGFPKPPDSEVAVCKASGAEAVCPGCGCDNCAVQLDRCGADPKCAQLSIDCYGPCRDGEPCHPRCDQSYRDNSEAVGLANQAVACIASRCPDCKGGAKDVVGNAL